MRTMAELKKSRLVFVCQECGLESPRWQGRCPECNAWNTFVERTVRPAAPNRPRPLGPAAEPIEVASLSGDAHPRLSVGIPEFDRVLGGGIVPGSVTLIGGDPGVGKTTLLTQVTAEIAAMGKNVLYISGEESAHQLKLRAGRLGISGK